MKNTGKNCRKKLTEDRNLLQVVQMFNYSGFPHSKCIKSDIICFFPGNPYLHMQQGNTQMKSHQINLHLGH